MPSPNYLPAPQQQPNPLGGILAGFIGKQNEYQTEDRESDALARIYKQHLNDGNNIQKKIEAINSSKELRPTTKAQKVKEALEYGKYNTEMQERAQKAYKEKQKEESNKAQVADIAKRRGITDPETLRAYENDPKAFEVVTRPPKEGKINQADRPIDPDQQINIDKVLNSPDWEKATIPQKTQMLARGNVSNANSKNIIDAEVETQKIAAAREKAENANRNLYHKETAKFDEELHKAAKGAKHQLDAIKDSEKAVKSGNVKPTSLANVFRTFGEVGTKIGNALLNNDEVTLLSSIPAFLEGRKELFGVRLSDADLKLLQDKLPDISKSPEANLTILNLMKKYSQAAILREEIASSIKKENKGLRPLGYVDEIESRFDDMMTPVKIINPITGNEIEIPAYKVGSAVKAGGKIVKKKQEDF